MNIRQKIMPCLWFDTQAEEAANFYVSIFKNSKILEVSRYGEGGPMPAGTALTVTFQLEGLQFMALNGGPEFNFSEAVSLYVDCEDQAEVDELWAKLTDGGQESMCGWLKDRYGLSWQIVPRALGEMMQDEDPARAQRVMEALLQMKKLDLTELQRAYDTVPV
jgi:predicted 3-demethylubiquinone-9 3-methyltransferase (glyoxalase superfamily)